jgi:hypothetical protein
MAAAAASAAAAALSTFTTFTAFTHNLTLLAARLDARTRLTAGRGSLSAHCRLRRARADIPVARRAPVMIPIVLTAIAITVTIASIATTSFYTSFCTSAVTAPLSSFGPARLP